MSAAGEGEACCPVSLEPFQERGPHRPLILPACGHTLSKAAVKRLLESRQPSWRWGVPIMVLECPLCNAPQPFLDAVSQCVPNWALIQQLGGGGGRARAQPARAQLATPEQPPGVEWAAGLSRQTVTTEDARLAFSPHVPDEVPGLECAPALPAAAHVPSLKFPRPRASIGEAARRAAAADFVFPLAPPKVRLRKVILRARQFARNCDTAEAYDKVLNAHNRGAMLKLAELRAHVHRTASGDAGRRGAAQYTRDAAVEVWLQGRTGIDATQAGPCSAQPVQPPPTRCVTLGARPRKQRAWRLRRSAQTVRDERRAGAPEDSSAEVAPLAINNKYRKAARVSA